MAIVCDCPHPAVLFIISKITYIYGNTLNFLKEFTITRRKNLCYRPQTKLRDVFRGVCLSIIEAGQVLSFGSAVLLLITA